MTSLTFACVFSMFVYIRAHFRSMLIGRNLTAQSTGSHRELEVEFKFQRLRCKLSLLPPLPPPTLPECPRECSRRLIDALWKMKVKLLLFVCLLFCEHLWKTFLNLGSKYNVLLAFVEKPEKRYQLGKHGRAENSYVGQGHLEEVCSCSAIVVLVVIVVGKQILSLTFFFVVRAAE